MRAAANTLELEAAITAWLTAAPDWTAWTLTGTRRNRHTPTVLAIHAPTGRLVAVHVRPRRLHPSEQPPPQAHPHAAAHVVWHPALAVTARRWIALPATDPPGLIAGTWEAP